MWMFLPLYCRCVTALARAHHVRDFQLKKSPICSTLQNNGGLRRNASPVCKTSTVVRLTHPTEWIIYFLVLPYMAVC